MRDNFMDWNLGRRIKNMVWTVSDNHNVKVGIGGDSSHTDTKSVQISDASVMIRAGVSREAAYDSSMYAAAHEGAHVRLSSKDAIIDFLKAGKASGADLKALNGLAQITEDYRIDYTTIKERPGYQDLRDSSAASIISMFGKKLSGDETFDTTKAISAMTYGLDMRKYGDTWKKLDWDKITTVAEALVEGAKTSNNSAEALEVARQQYEKHFRKTYIDEKDGGEGEPDEDSDDEEGGEKSGETDKKTPSKSEPTSGEEDESECDEDEDSEGDSDSEDDASITAEKDGEEKGGGKPGKSGKAGKPTSEPELSKKELDEMVDEIMEGGALDHLLDEKGKEKLETAKERVERDDRSGRSTEENIEQTFAYIKKAYADDKMLWTKEEHARIERELCKGIHAGTKLLYMKSTHKVRTSSNMRVLEGKAKQLSDKMREDMKAALSQDGYVSDNGNVMANKCYRATKISDNRVFTKQEYTDEGGYVVDLLLDASGSQGGRIQEIGEQAYIIARACSLSGIPCRVTDFSVNSNVTMIRRYRDYDDPATEDMKCLGFRAQGDNRDGLAIQAVFEGLQQRSEEKKMFLMLSDGEPSDVSGGGMVSESGGLKYYSGVREKWKGDGQTTAVIDTAQTIRRIRSKGIPLMGIYVGYPGTTLEWEKLMFGNDFAYIGDNMANFVPIVAKYIHKQILNIG